MSQNQTKYGSLPPPEWQFNYAVVQQLRLKLRLSKRALGRLADISEATIRRIEAKQNEPRSGTIIRLAEALSVEPADFFTKGDESWK